jgi:hypothetical protein
MRDDTPLKVSTIDPCYTNIINYNVVGYIPPGADKKRLSKIAYYTSMMTRICIGCALTAY